MSDDEFSRLQHERQQGELSPDDKEVSVKNGGSELERYLRNGLQLQLERYNLDVRYIFLGFALKKEEGRAIVRVDYLSYDSIPVEIYVEDLDFPNTELGLPVESKTWKDFLEKIMIRIDLIAERIKRNEEGKEEAVRRMEAPRNAIEMIFPEDEGESLDLKIVTHDAERAWLTKENGYVKKEHRVAKTTCGDGGIFLDRIVEEIQALRKAGNVVYIENAEEFAITFNEVGYVKTKIESAIDSGEWVLVTYAKKIEQEEEDTKQQKVKNEVVEPAINYMQMNHEKLHAALTTEFEKNPMKDIGLVMSPTSEYQKNIVATLAYTRDLEAKTPDFTELRNDLEYISNNMPGKTRLQIMMRTDEVDISQYGYEYIVQVFVHSEDLNNIPEDIADWGAVDSYEREEEASASYASHTELDAKLEEENAVRELAPILAKLQDELDIPRSQLVLTARKSMRNGLLALRLKGDSVKSISLDDMGAKLFNPHDIQRLRENFLALLKNKKNPNGNLVVYVHISNVQNVLNFTCKSINVAKHHLAGGEAEDGSEIYNDKGHLYLQTVERLNASGARQLNAATGGEFESANSLLHSTMEKWSKTLKREFGYETSKIPSRLWTMPLIQGVSPREEILRECGLEIANEEDIEISHTPDTLAMIEKLMIDARSLTDKYEFLFVETAGPNKPIRLIPVTFVKHGS